jgi:hypothetical protein
MIRHLLKRLFHCGCALALMVGVSHACPVAVQSFAVAVPAYAVAAPACACAQVAVQAPQAVQVQTYVVPLAVQQFYAPMATGAIVAFPSYSAAVAVQAASVNVAVVGGSRVRVRHGLFGQTVVRVR